MENQEKLTQLRTLSTLAEAAWLRTASEYSALKMKNEKLVRRASEVSSVGRDPTFLYSVAGRDRSLHQWKQAQLRKINQTRLQLKIEMATIEVQLKEDFGKMNAISTLIKRRK